ncbi:hypothetical protein HY571_01220 [Candidatus Micrarchaeota archaeon]|nr:hypothetical protein [Candidatus Micrarchaeota archaeon]
MPFICSACGREFKDEEFQTTLSSGSVRCTYCGGKSLFKKTPPIARTVGTD